MCQLPTLRVIAGLTGAETDWLRVTGFGDDADAGRDCTTTMRLGAVVTSIGAVGGASHAEGGASVTRMPGMPGLVVRSGWVGTAGLLGEGAARGESMSSSTSSAWTCARVGESCDVADAPLRLPIAWKNLADMCKHASRARGTLQAHTRLKVEGSAVCCAGSRQPIKNTL